MTPDEWSKFQADHGGLAGSSVLDPYTKDVNGTRIENATPRTRYTFKDGKTITVVQAANGTVSVVDPGTAYHAPAAAKSKAAAAPKIVNVNGRAYSENPDGTLTPQTDPVTTAPKVITVNGRAYSENPDGTLTPQTDAKTEPTVQMPDPANPGHMIDVTVAQAKAMLDQQKVDNSTDRVDLAYRTADLRALAQDKANQIAMMNVDNSTKTRLFDEWWKQNVDLPKAELDTQTSLYNTGQAAGMDAAKLAEMGTTNAVGPLFGANFADALTGLATGDRSKVHFSPNDFTYQQPDYNAIAQKGAAAAIAHLSPYAASIMGTQPPSGYQPPQQPVLTTAANTVVLPPAPATLPPNPAPIQPPPYRPPGFVG